MVGPLGRSMNGRSLAMVGLLASALAPLAAQADVGALVQQLGDVNQRAAARTQLLAMGSEFVPALADALAGASGEKLDELLAILTELGPAAGAAVPQLLERAKKRGEQVVDIVATLAELAPWCPPDIAPRWENQRAMVFMACLEVQRGFPVCDRLQVRTSFARDTAIEDLITIIDGRRAWHRELAIELLGRRGPAARAALPALRRVFEQPEPRVLPSDRTVPLRAKAAKAVLAIAPDGDDASTAREVLAGVRAAPAPMAPVLPERAHVRIDELVRELADPAARAAAVTNLVAFGAPVAKPVAASLASSDADTQRAALAVLRELGPGAAAALPPVLDALGQMPAANVLDALDIVLAATASSRDVVPQVISGLSATGAFVSGRLIEFDEDSSMERFSMMMAQQYAARTVDANASLPEFEAWLAFSCPFMRERALVALAPRGEKARPLLVKVGEMLRAAHPPHRVRQQNTVVDRTPFVQRAAARAIVAIAVPGDPLVTEAKALLAEPERAK